MAKHHHRLYIKFQLDLKSTPLTRSPRKSNIIGEEECEEAGRKGINQYRCCHFSKK